MKSRTPWILAVVIAITSLGCCKCKQECENAFALADLLINKQNLAFVGADSTQPIYELANDVLNSAEAVLCECRQCESVSTAEANQFATAVYYSASQTNNWGAAIDTFGTQLNPLDGCATATVKDVLEFLQDGWYLLQGLADFLEQVPERNEANNTDSITVNYGKRMHEPLIVHINQGLVSNVVDEYGRPVLVRRIRSEVEY